MSADQNKLLGQVLLERGVITKEQLAAALEGQARSGGRLVNRLYELNACDEAELVQALADQQGVPGIDLSRSTLSLEAVRRIPRAVAESDYLLPLSIEGGRIHVAAASPTEDVRPLAEVRFVTGMEISPYVAVLGALQKAVRAAYAAAERGDRIWRGSLAPPGLAAQLAVLLPSLKAGLPEVSEVDVNEVQILIEEDSGDGDDDGAEIVIEPAAAQRVLVVDDDPEIRLLARRALEKGGYQTDVAEHGLEALQRVAAKRPAVILLDAMLPHVHGFEVCRQLKGDPQTRDIAIVMMTAIYRGWRFAQDAHESYGADDYLEKPFHIDDLLRRVEQALKGPEENRESREKLRELCDAGVAKLRTKQWDGAREAFEQGLRLDPFAAGAHYGLAQALKGKGEAFSAMSEFERAVELRPSMFAALRTLAGLYLDKGFRRKAIETLERALRVAPDSPTQETLKHDLLGLLS